MAEPAAELRKRVAGFVASCDIARAEANDAVSASRVIMSIPRPLKRVRMDEVRISETELPKAAVGAAVAGKASLLAFINIELELAATFAHIAETTSDIQKNHRLIRKAFLACETILYLRRNLTLTEKCKLDAKLWPLLRELL